MADYTHLNLVERYQLEAQLEMGLKVSDIANRLGRHRSTIYRELSNNKGEKPYQAELANKKAHQRRPKKPLKIQRIPGLYYYVAQKLVLGWSPEQIAGRMRLENKPFSICHETLYNYVYHHAETGLCYLLTSKRRKRKKHARVPELLCRYGEERLITNRSQDIESRESFGHWEGDLILFREHKKNSVTTLVERQTRLLFMLKNTEKVSQTVMSRIGKRLAKYSHDICHTVTFDQGTEFSGYHHLAKHLPCQVYYCHKRSPWEKGSNENMNGRIRRYLPRKTNMCQISQRELDLLADKMNTQPRKCLGFKTPMESFLANYG